MEKETIIELQNIRKEFPGVIALDNVNMKIRSSEVHALVGENGAGKSTLMIRKLRWSCNLQRRRNPYEM